LVTDPLGPVEQWPQSLRTSVSTCLDCAFPIILWWGPELTILYNDEYSQFLGRNRSTPPKLVTTIAALANRFMARRDQSSDVLRS
jgi:hypothetical protein